MQQSFESGSLINSLGDTNLIQYQKLDKPDFAKATFHIDSIYIKINSIEFTHEKGSGCIVYCCVSST